MTSRRWLVMVGTAVFAEFTLRASAERAALAAVGANQQRRISFRDGFARVRGPRGSATIELRERRS